MKRNLEVVKIQPRSRHRKMLSPDFMICLGEPTQRGASTRIILSKPQAEHLHRELGKKLRSK